VDSSLADRPAQLQQQRPGLDPAILGDDPRVGHKHIRGEVGDRARVQELPVIAICVDLPGTDDPDIPDKKPAFCRPSDLSVEIGDQQTMTLIDGQQRRADSNFERHREIPELRIFSGKRNTAKLMPHPGARASTGSDHRPQGINAGGHQPAAEFARPVAFGTELVAP
jgi:hypothetical protein